MTLVLILGSLPNARARPARELRLTVQTARTVPDFRLRQRSRALSTPSARSGLLIRASETENLSTREIASKVDPARHYKNGASELNVVRLIKPPNAEPLTGFDVATQVLQSYSPLDTSVTLGQYGIELRPGQRYSLQLSARGTRTHFKGPFSWSGLFQLSTQVGRTALHALEVAGTDVFPTDVYRALSTLIGPRPEAGEWVVPHSDLTFVIQRASVQGDAGFWATLLAPVVFGADGFEFASDGFRLSAAIEDGEQVTSESVEFTGIFDDPLSVR